MTVAEYVVKQGLSVEVVAHALGIGRENLHRYGCVHKRRKRIPKRETLKRVAAVMTEMGVPTKTKDLYAAIRTRIKKQNKESKKNGQGNECRRIE